VGQYDTALCQKVYQFLYSPLSRDTLKKVKMLTTYVCGDGKIAAYKLEMEFNECNHFISKVKAEQYTQTFSAKQMDLLVEQFLESYTT